MDIVNAIEDVPKSPGDKPKEKVTISASGELDLPETSEFLCDPSARLFHTELDIRH